MEIFVVTYWYMCWNVNGNIFYANKLFFVWVVRVIYSTPRSILNTIIMKIPHDLLLEHLGDLYFFRLVYMRANIEPRGEIWEFRKNEGVSHFVEIACVLKHTHVQ